MSSSRGEGRGPTRRWDRAWSGTFVGRKQRYAQDADYRARASARRRAYHQAHKDEISTRRPY
jgi:hypothetical protein